MLPAALLPFALLCVARPPFQDAPPPPPPAPTIVEWLDVDGAPLLPGALPKSTKEEARTAFELVRASPRIKLAEPYVVAGFELKVDLRYRGSDGQRNDLPDAVWQWLAPDCLRLTTGRKRELVRGPKGDWLVDASRTPVETIELGVAREYRQDKRALDEGAALARTLQALLDMRALRVRRLEETVAPVAPNQSLAERSKELRWLLLETPDLQLPGEPGKPPASMVRAALGCDRVTGLVEQAQLAECRRAEGAAEPVVGPVLLHIAMRDHRPVDGILLPHHFAVHGAENGKLRAEAGVDGYLRGATLKPAFARESFVPPSKQPADEAAPPVKRD